MHVKYDVTNYCHLCLDVFCQDQNSIVWHILRPVHNRLLIIIIIIIFVKYSIIIIITIIITIVINNIISSTLLIISTTPIPIVIILIIALQPKPLNPYPPFSPTGKLQVPSRSCWMPSQRSHSTSPARKGSSRWSTASATLSNTARSSATP